MSFAEELSKYKPAQVKEQILSCSKNDVISALNRAGNGKPADFAALISPAADEFLEEMAQLSFNLTRKRFGNTVQLYIPMYLSNECQNVCTYCGFSYQNKIERLTLNDQQILQEVAAIKKLGYDHILLLSGEANKTVGLDYFKNAIRLVRPFFSNISMEVQPLLQDEYAELKEAGLHSVLVYQETYFEENYKTFHPKGKKSNFHYRLETPERLGRANIHKIGIGVLLGLNDWRTDSWFTALHLAYLEKQFWKSRFSLSFPRLRPAEGVVLPENAISERQLTQLICAYRIFNENVELSLSTRERPAFRDNIIKLGITTLSAGSKTDPGGYSLGKNSLKQFEVSDERAPQLLVDVLKQNNLEPVWKDWDVAYS